MDFLQFVILLTHTFCTKPETSYATPHSPRLTFAAKHITSSSSVNSNTYYGSNNSNNCDLSGITEIKKKKLKLIKVTDNTKIILFFGAVMATSYTEKT